MKSSSVFFLLVFLGVIPSHVADDDQPQTIANQLMDADQKQFPVIFPKFKELGERGLPFLVSEIDRKVPADAKDDAKEKLAKRQANAAVALLLMNQPEKVWPLLKHSPDPTLRSFLIHRMAPLGVDAKVIVKRLEKEPDLSSRRTLLLSLGEYDEKEFSVEDRKALLPKLQAIYRDDSDPGLHGASEWLLRQWKQEAWLKQINEEWVKDKEARKKRLESIGKSLAKEKTPQWYVNGQGQTIVVIPGSVELMMGSPKSEKDRDADEVQHRRRIERNFAIASKEVTVEQFLKFRKGHEYSEKSAPTTDCPVNRVWWYDAAAYCNWLSEQEGIPKEQWCYLPNKEGKYEDGMTMAPGYLKRTGYRLPTEAEWEFSCRAGSESAYSFGQSVEVLRKYAGWYDSPSSPNKSHPVGTLKSNDLGYFDMHGNNWEWCQDVSRDSSRELKNKAAIDHDEQNKINPADHRVMRGGCFASYASSVRSAYRIDHEPSFRNYNIGFRLARTVTP